MFKAAINLGSQVIKLDREKFTKHMAAAYCKFFDEDFEDLFLKLEYTYVGVSEITDYVNADIEDTDLIEGVDTKGEKISSRGFEKILKASTYDQIDYRMYFNKLKQISVLYDIYAIEYNSEIQRRRSDEIKKLYAKHRVFISVLKSMNELSVNEKNSAILVNKIYDDEYQMIHARYNSMLI